MSDNGVSGKKDAGRSRATFRCGRRVVLRSVCPVCLASAPLPRNIRFPRRPVRMPLRTGRHKCAPTGEMVFTALGAVAELERNLIVERVRAGLGHAKAKGKRLGRPKKSVDAGQILSLRAAGASWRVTARKLGVSVGSVFAVAKSKRHQTRVEDTNGASR